MNNISETIPLKLIIKNVDLISTRNVTLSNPVEGAFKDITKQAKFWSQNEYNYYIDIFCADINNNDYPDAYYLPDITGAPWGAYRTFLWGTDSLKFKLGDINISENITARAGYTDINNDYLLDIYESNQGGGTQGQNVLLQNLGSSFKNISKSSNTYRHSGDGQGFVSFDYNNDGYLDLFISNGIGRTNKLLLYQNNGNLTFTEVTDSVGAGLLINGEHVAAGDINNDGLTDVYVTGYNTNNLLLLAEREPITSKIKYRNIAQSAGVDISGSYSCSDFGDLNNDGYLDLVVLGVASNTCIFINQHNNTFQKIIRTEEKGLDLLIIDYDNDSYLDIITVGDLIAPTRYALKNNGNLNFSKNLHQLGFLKSAFEQYASSDFNLDGFMDIASIQYENGTKPLLMMNTGNDHSFLSLKLFGKKSNSLGIGSRIELWEYNKMQMRFVAPNLGNDIVQIFGLGQTASTEVDSLIIYWPSGIKQRLYNIPINQILKVTENDISNIEINKNKVYAYNLLQNYPNPFNPNTRINYSVGSQSQVIIKIYDVLGNEIKTLVNEIKAAGEYQVEFNVGTLASGIYIYKMSARSYSCSKKMMVIK